MLNSFFLLSSQTDKCCARNKSFMNAAIVMYMICLEYKAINVSYLSLQGKRLCLMKANYHMAEQRSTDQWCLVDER